MTLEKGKYLLVLEVTVDEVIVDGIAVVDRGWKHALTTT